jgi:hypothetical protein
MNRDMRPKKKEDMKCVTEMQRTMLSHKDRVGLPVQWYRINIGMEA